MSLSRNNFTTNTFLSPEGESQTLDQPLTSISASGSQGINLSWTVLDLSRIATLKQRSAGLRASERRVDDQRLAVVANVQRSYVEALRRQTLLELTRRQIRDRELELDIARRRYEIAAVELSDVLGAETLLLNAEVSLLSETSRLETGLRALSVSMGLSAEAGPGTTLVDLTNLPAAEGISAEALVAYALNEDPELLALEADRAAASATLWGTKGRFLPTIQVGYGWRWSEQFGPGDDFFQFLLGDTGRGLSATASWQLFDGFSRVSQTQSASFQRFRASESLRQRRLEIERDVLRFLRQIEELAQSLVLLDRVFQLTQERLDMTRLQYQNGTADFTALQQAIGTVTSAERTLIEQRYNYLLTWADLEEFVGEIR